MVGAAEHASGFFVGIPEHQHMRFIMVKDDVISHHFSTHSNAVVCVLPRFNFLILFCILIISKKFFTINYLESNGQGKENNT